MAHPQEDQQDFLDFLSFKEFHITYSLCFTDIFILPLSSITTVWGLTSRAIDLQSPGPADYNHSAPDIRRTAVTQDTEEKHENWAADHTSYIKGRAFVFEVVFVHDTTCSLC